MRGAGKMHEMGMRGAVERHGKGRRKTPGREIRASETFGERRRGARSRGPARPGRSGRVATGTEVGADRAVVA